MATIADVTIQPTNSNGATNGSVKAPVLVTRGHGSIQSRGYSSNGDVPSGLVTGTSKVPNGSTKMRSQGRDQGMGGRENKETKSQL